MSTWHAGPICADKRRTRYRLGFVLPDELNSRTDELLARAEDLAARSRAVEAIGLLTDANRTQQDPLIEQTLVSLRIRAWDQMDRTGRTRELDRVADLFPHESGIPIVAVDDLDATVMRSAIVHHGAIVVRNLLPSARCASLCDAIDKSWEAIGRYEAAGETNPAWFAPIQASGYGADMQSRMWGLKSGTAYVADSPRLFFELIEAFDDIGMKEIVGDYFGEPPMLSLAKTAQRRLPADAVGEWHQDAAVYGATAKALDVWIPMSRCGDLAPGLELWPRRLENVLETVGPGALEFGTRPEIVSALTKDVRSVHPVFDPGDAAIFDELFATPDVFKPDVHGTSLRVRDLVLHALDIPRPGTPGTDRLLMFARPRGESTSRLQPLAGRRRTSASGHCAATRESPNRGAQKRMGSWSLGS